MSELERSLNTRDGAEDFRDFLEKTSKQGLETFNLFLILNGYQKEAERYYRLHGFNEHYVKWNVKCCKALMDKYFKVCLLDYTRLDLLITN